MTHTTHIIMMILKYYFLLDHKFNIILTYTVTIIHIT